MLSEPSVFVTLHIQINYMRKKKNIFDYLDFVDIPVIALVGTATGHLMTGFVLALSSIFVAGRGEVLSVRALVASALCLLISAIVLCLTYLYWIAIPKRCGAVYPELNGFGAIIALMSMLSSMLLSVNLYFWILHTC